MATTTVSTDVAEQAKGAALRAAEAAMVSVRELHSAEDLARAGDIFDAVWDAAPQTILPSNLARALVHAGHYCAGAFAGERLVGGVFGFLGARNGQTHLHSHLLAVRPDAGEGGVGYALKQHQRAWALERGLSEVSWTFDPLVRRNAYFNLCKLGASIVQYHENFYGSMTDGVNAGDESDRVLVRWPLASARAIETSAGRTHDGRDIDQLRAAGGLVVLDDDGTGSPASSDDRSAPILLSRIPADIVALRRSDPARAHAWRKALRDVMKPALAEGYVTTEITREGWYVLQRA